MNAGFLMNKAVRISGIYDSAHFQVSEWLVFHIQDPKELMSMKQKNKENIGITMVLLSSAILVYPS